MCHVSDESQASRSALRIRGHVNVPNFTELAKHSEERVSRYLEVYVVNEYLGEGAKVLVTSAVRGLLFIHVVGKRRELFSGIQHDHLAAAWCVNFSIGGAPHLVMTGVPLVCAAGVVSMVIGSVPVLIGGRLDRRVTRVRPPRTSKVARLVAHGRRCRVLQMLLLVLTVLSLASLVVKVSIIVCVAHL